LNISAFLSLSTRFQMHSQTFPIHDTLGTATVDIMKSEDGYYHLPLKNLQTVNLTRSPAKARFGRPYCPINLMLTLSPSLIDF